MSEPTRGEPDGAREVGVRRDRLARDSEALQGLCHPRIERTARPGCKLEALEEVCMDLTEIRFRPSRIREPIDRRADGCNSTG